MRVQITKMPLGKAAYGKQVQGSLSLNPGAFGGADYKSSKGSAYTGVKETVDEVPREEANLEAEGGETAFGPISGQSIPDHLKIRGKRHSEGGVPLNLPDDTFIFSDTASLKINDPSVLAMFNKTPKKGGYTPAELAKPYNINKYKSILLDPDTSKLERDTATIMIKNYIMKLGALALVQESMKGFPQGVPEMAKPYMEANGISEEDLMPELKEQADALEQAMASGQQTGMPQEQNPMMAQEMQQMAPEQAMQADQAMLEQSQGAPAYPEQMPSGAPVASPEMMAQMAGQGQMPPQQMMPEQGMPPQPGMMQYGGIPYAMYGMEMGGYDFPYHPEQMAMGGMPKFGGPGDSQVTTNTTSATITDPAVLKKEYQTGKHTAGTAQAGKTYVDIGDGISGIGTESGTDVAWSYSGNGGGNWNPTRQQALDQYCKNMQNPKSKLFYGVDHVKIAEANFGYLKNSKNPKDQAEYAAIVEKLKGCKAGGKQTTYEYVKKTEPGETPCLCLNKDGSVYKDANGNTKEAPKDANGVCQPNDPTCGGETETIMCRCTDPVTGEVKEFPIEREEECICQDGSRGQVGGGDNPHWSVPAKTNIMRNALMQVNPAPSNVVLPGRAQAQGAYEEYQTKVDTAQAAVNSLQNAVMTGMAGATGAKQAQMKDLLGKSLRASMDAVAGVQSRNVDRQRETNVQSATVDNANMLARNTIMNQGLALQKNDKDTLTGNKNKRLFNTMGAVIEADKEMGARQNMNVLTPQYASEYDYGFITPTGVEKPLTGATGATLEDRIQHYLGRTGDYAQAFDMAYKEARLKSQFGGQRMGNGGYVLASNVFPFLL